MNSTLVYSYRAYRNHISTNSTTTRVRFRDFLDEQHLDVFVNNPHSGKRETTASRDRRILAAVEEQSQAYLLKMLKARMMARRLIPDAPAEPKRGDRLFEVVGELALKIYLSNRMIHLNVSYEDLEKKTKIRIEKLWDYFLNFDKSFTIDDLAKITTALDCKIKVNLVKE